ncbi:MAG TPA: asparagine synthase (glutamine-hydrolyzing) [bacterium]|nr:asparagine synthase (glutamine-hydrolyzing) [bacterium]HOL47765.1 asparagine synthase (glutamine-hydrolyzing) [bacterium]HPQ19358.1 asparagine synthase (glutamine-hydrolyzing) [bacterium]
MCGICGVYSKSEKINIELFKRMTNELEHRGPDEFGFYFDDKIALGHRRLSIIDLSTGKQPMHNEDESIYIVYNGEFYNFQDYISFLQNKNHILKTKSDTEIILHLYEEYGIKVLEKIRGMFSFAIWDKNQDLIFLARDRIGKKPLYYTFQNDKFYFASELKALVKDPSVKREISNQSIDLYLTYQYIPAPYTIYKDIYKLGPAEYILVKNGKLIKKERYWENYKGTNYNIKYEEAKEQLKELLFESVKLRLISDVPIGAFLSGGIDSSIITAIMAKISNKQIKTFSIGFEEADYNEIEYARLVAKKYNTDHKEFIVKPDAIQMIDKLAYFYNEPYADSSALPTYYVSKMTSQFVKVALNGDGGDELFAGYYRYSAIKFLNLINKNFLLKPLVKVAASVIPKSGFNNRRIIQIRNFLKRINLPEFDAIRTLMLYFDDETRNRIYSDEFKKSISYEQNYNFLKSAFDKFQNANNIVQQIMLMDQITYLPDCLLVKVDIATMMNSLEGRAPILDYKVIEFANSLPNDFKLKGFDRKYIFRDTFKDLLPPEIFERGKMGFGVPLFHWFRNELKDLAYDVILNGHFIKNNYFKKEEVKKILDAHINKTENNAFKIWTLLMLEKWYEAYHKK